MKKVLNITAFIAFVLILLGAACADGSLKAAAIFMLAGAALGFASSLGLKACGARR